MMCPTKPLLIHLVRGVLGVVFLVTTFSPAGSLPLVALLLGGQRAGCLSRLPDVLACRTV